MRQGELCHTGFTPFYPKGVGWVQSRRARRCTSTECAKWNTQSSVCWCKSVASGVCKRGKACKTGWTKDARLHNNVHSVQEAAQEALQQCSSAAAPGAVHERELSRLEACRVCTELAQGCAPTRRFALQGACRGAEVCAKGVQGVRRACTSWGTGCAVVEVALHICAQSHAEDA